MAILAITSIQDFFFFFFNDTATTEIYTLSLHDALPISLPAASTIRPRRARSWHATSGPASRRAAARSEEHTSELQSQSNLVCRLLLEKKKPLADSGYEAVPSEAHGCKMRGTRALTPQDD